MQSSKTGCLKTFYRIIFLTNILLTVSGTSVEDTIKHCCNLGTNYASSGLKCSDFQPPIAGINPEDEKFCLSSVDVCCKKQYRELECEAGKYDAKAKKDCTSSSDGTEFKKECCEACKLGIDAGSSGQASSCQISFGFGAPADSAFTTCCKESSPANILSTPPSTTVTPATTPRISTMEEPDSYDSIPPIENLCDIGEICAHICIPTGNSFRCECNKGFMLMDDGTSCKPLKTIARTNTGNKKTPNRCEQNNPCDHICTDTGVAIKCSCNEGYVLESDKLTCTDIDECATGEYDCSPGEDCINAEGGYYCEYSDDGLLGGEDSVFDKCPEGYKFNGEKSVCDDIDECEFGIMCPRPKTCINTVGSFKCEGEDLPQCPPGFYYKPAIDTCADIDECLSGENDCNKESQICLNTKGNYTCIDKASKNKCPAGFKKNPYTQICEDIDECLENSEVCDRDETCINEPSGYKCVPNSLNNIIPTQTDAPSTVPYTTTTSTSPRTSPVTPRTTSKTTTTQRTPRIQNRYNVCSKGFRYSADADRCVDIDECKEDSNACDSAQECYNAPGSYVCQCKNGYNKDFQTGACIDVNECQIGQHDCSIGQRCDNTIGSYICSRIAGCGTGYTLNYASGLCEDDDECALGTHNCHGLGPTFRCRNTLGSYRCDPIRTTTSTTTTTTTTTTTPRPHFITYPTLPTYPVYPKRCLPGYKLSGEGVCEDLDECVLGTHRCNDYGHNLECRNTIGSYVCEPARRITTTQATTPRIIPFRPVPPDSPIITQRKRCLPGYRMNALGQCEDIDECQSNPCGPGQKCLNFNGRYQCLSNLQCKYGYELNEVGDKCVDVNECARGTHKCTPSQICKNGEGYYICECPPGHHMPRGSTLCEDINECQTFYRVCPLQADCINTIGSYECRCKDGFKETEDSCVDIDECKESPGLCEHNCVNTWGSYRCACMPGFTLNSDNRTCTDVDECVKFKDRKLCVGTCENVPGSYTCKCPRGYKLGEDGRTCRDIDECENNVCPRPNDICLNTRGSYKCFTLTCPPNYYRDPSHKSRCKRAQNICDFRDLSCTQLPDQYTSHYISFSSLLPVTHGPIPFFQIKGPHWGGSRVEFTMEIGDVQCPPGVERITENNFRMIRSAQNSLQLAIIRPLQGPQEAQLIVKMFIYHSDIVTTHVVFYIYIVVSEYEF